MKALFFSVAILFFSSTAKTQFVLSQQTISSASEGYTGSTLMIDYTIGELAAVTTLVTPGFIFTQGLHQPDKFVVGIKDLTKPAWNVSAFPNPFSGMLNLTITSGFSDEVVIELFDASGRLICKPSAARIFPGEATIPLDFSSIAGGTYFMRINLKKTGTHTMIPVIRLFE